MRGDDHLERIHGALREIAYDPAIGFSALYIARIHSPNVTNLFGAETAIGVPALIGIGAGMNIKNIADQLAGKFRICPMPTKGSDDSSQRRNARSRHTI